MWMGMSNYNNFSLNTEKYEVCLKSKITLFMEHKKTQIQQLVKHSTRNGFKMETTC